MARNLWFVLMLAIVCASSVLAVAPWTITQVTSSGDSNSKVDIAAGPNDVIYRVFERDSQIYYSNSITNVESLVADGTSPAIAVGPDKKPQIVFLNNGNWDYAVLNGNAWTITSFSSNVNYVDIAVDNNNKAHVAYSANYDNDPYNEIYYTDNVNGAWSGPALIADGWYADHAGNYFYDPNIKVDDNGYYHIAMKYQNWGGQASWSSDYAYVNTNAPTGTTTSSDFSYGSISVGSNSIGLDSYGHEIMLYSSGNMYLGVIVGNTWHQINLGAGSNPSLDVKDDKVAIVYTDSLGMVEYISATVPADYPTSDLTFSAPSTIDSGSYPVVGLGSVTVDYLNFHKDVQQIYEAYIGGGHGGNSNTQEPQVPEFGIVAGAFALIGALAIFVYRRK